MDRNELAKKVLECKELTTDEKLEIVKALTCEPVSVPPITITKPVNVPIHQEPLYPYIGDFPPPRYPGDMVTYTTHTTTSKVSDTNGTRL